MIVTYLRSSSIGSWEWCGHQGFLSYTLGLKSPSNIKAEKGNIVHKVMECLAHVKKCQQDNIETFETDGLGVLNVSDCTPNFLLDKSFEYATKTATHVCWSQADYRECQRWVNTALNFRGGMFDPRNANILEPEKRFDFTIPYEWANYEYKLPSGKEVKGKLSIKGTMDLVVDLDNGKTIEIVDYKTGRRLCWSSGKIKDFKKLNNDKQLMLYFYASSLLYPQADTIIVTIYFINDGGPYTIAFTKKDIPRIEEMLKSTFNDMRSCIVPRQDVSWKCTKICHFGRTKWNNSNKTICEHIHDEIIKKGISKVTEEYGVDGAYSNYGDGGGRKDKTS